MSIDGQGYPVDSQLHIDKRYTSDNIALGETIINDDIAPGSIILFDRGLYKRKTFAQVTEKDIFFVSRLKTRYKREIVEDRPLSAEEIAAGITKHMNVRLFGSGPCKATKHVYRVIHLKPQKNKTTNKKRDFLKSNRAQLKTRRLRHAGKTKEELYKEIDAEEIIFVTNIPEKKMTVQEVTELYKKRWNIELFFRLIKQLFSFSHLLNRTENGIQFVMYVTMIAAMILLAYKTLKGLTGEKNLKETLIMDLRSRAPGTPSWMLVPYESG